MGGSSLGAGDADFDTRPRTASVPQALAVLCRHPKTNPCAPTRKGATALSAACENGHAGAVAVLLCHPKVKPNKKHHGRPPLLQACMHGRAEVCGVVRCRTEALVRIALSPLNSLHAT